MGILTPASHRKLIRLDYAWALLGTVPWVTILGCTCPQSNREMKLTPEGLGVIAASKDGKTLTAEQCQDVCSGQDPRNTAMHWTCAVKREDEGTHVECSGYMPCVGGRRSEALGEAEGSSPSDAFFVRLAALEAESVISFVELSQSLAAHGAPKSLVERALLAAAEEVTHAELALQLAREDGWTDAPRLRRHVEGCPEATREASELSAMALHNAGEGSVREAFGAMVVEHQARHAASEQVGRAMRRIAPEEKAHARLASDVEAWTFSMLPSRQRRMIRDHKADTRDRLLAEAAMEPTVEERIRFGLPSAEEAIRLAASLPI